MTSLVKALSAFALQVGGVPHPTLAQANRFHDQRHTELNQAPTNEIVLAEVNLYYGAAYRFAYRTGEAIVHLRAAHEGYLTFEHPENVRAAALCAWALADTYLYEDNAVEAKIWYWKALAAYTKLDGLGADTTRSCLEDFQRQASVVMKSGLLSSHLRGIKRLSDQVVGKS